MVFGFLMMNLKVVVVEVVVQVLMVIMQFSLLLVVMEVQV
jgi:hypothetical protein